MICTKSLPIHNQVLSAAPPYVCLIDIVKAKLVRFAHNWNVGMLE